MNHRDKIYCPLCRKESIAFKIWIKTDNGNILQCKKCGLGFLNPQCYSKIDDLNTSLYNSKSYYKLLNRIQTQLIIRYKNQMKEISKIVKEKGTLIDVGCSVGMFLNTAASFGFEPYGYDINTTNLFKAKKIFGINILPDNYLEDKKYNNFFDIATMWDVLEHLPDPVGFLSRLILKIKPRGLLVVQCPNMESYEFFKFGKEWNWLTPGDHLQFFTPKTLIKVLTVAGFRPIKVKLWMDGLTFSNSMTLLRNKDPTFIFNRLLVKIIRKIKIFLKYLGLGIPIEKVQSIYGTVLQIIHHARRQHSLIKIFAIKPDSSF